MKGLSSSYNSKKDNSTENKNEQRKWTDTGHKSNDVIKDRQYAY